MSLNISIGKAIWREPDKDKIFSISNGLGKDEFIIAPFKKDEKNISIKGVISESNQATIIEFFNDIQLIKTPENYSTSKTKYIQTVENAINAIKNNQFEKVVLALQYYIEKPIDPHTLFLHLVSEYKGAFVYCFVLENGTCMIGATPELLLKKESDKLITEALGGTGQPDGYSQKEHLEHQQIIIDISNKLNISNYPFTLSKTHIKMAGNVSHLSTIFTAKSKTDLSDLAMVKSLHPTSAVCGLPFQPAYDFLIQQEDFNRKYYAGYLGIKKTSDFSFYVNLRCAELVESGAILYAGAGINKDSNPENEWLETTNKLDTLRKWMI